MFVGFVTNIRYGRSMSFLHISDQELKRSTDELLGNAETKRPTTTILSLHSQGQLMLVVIIHNQKII